MEQGCIRIDARWLEKSEQVNRFLCLLVSPGVFVRAVFLFH